MTDDKIGFIEGIRRIVRGYDESIFTVSETALGIIERSFKFALDVVKHHGRYESVTAGTFSGEAPKRKERVDIEIGSGSLAIRPVTMEKSEWARPDYTCDREPFPLLRAIDEPNQGRCRALYKDNHALFHAAPGSGHNHQAWPGGYIDHVEEVMRIAVSLYWTLDAVRPLPFTVEDALLVLWLHDIEKPWKVKGRDWPKEERRHFARTKIVEYGIVLTPEQENALRYVEGEGDDYRGDRRIMNELAAFCHCCDVISARIWHDEPRAEQGPGDERQREDPGE